MRRAVTRTRAQTQMACEWFWSTSELPQARLHELVDMPFVLRLTCKGMRDAHHEGAEAGRPRKRVKVVVFWTVIAEGYKTKSWVGDVVTSVSRVAWAYNAKHVKVSTLVRCAAAAGALPSLEWLHQNANFSWANDFDACRFAAKHGHLNTLRWLVRTARARWDPRDIVDTAAKNGHLNCLKWAMHHGCETPRHLLHEVARNGHADVVEFLWIYNASEGVIEAVTEAAGQGHMNVLRMFHRHNLRWGRAPKEEAARCNKLEALKFLVKNDRHDFHPQELQYQEGWLEACIAMATKQGHVRVLEWLVDTFSEDCQINAAMCLLAARTGRIGVLKWILNRGHRDLLLEENVLQNAQWFRAFDVVEWLRQL